MAFRAAKKTNDYLVVRRLLCCNMNDDNNPNARHVMEPSSRGYRREGKLVENVPCNTCPVCGYKSLSDPVRNLVDHARSSHIDGYAEDFITVAMKVRV